MQASLASEFETWSVPAQSVCIQYSPVPLEQIRTAALDGYHRTPHGGVETGGVLFGTHKERAVLIVAQRPVACEFAKGPSFVLTQREEEVLTSNLKAWRDDPELANLEPVGWYRAHNRSEVLLSDADLRFFNRFFPEDWQVALIVRPASFGPTRAGFFFREPDGTTRAEASYCEFILASPRIALQIDARPAPSSLDTPSALTRPPENARIAELLEPERVPVDELGPRKPMVPVALAPRPGKRWYAASLTAAAIASVLLVTAAVLGYWTRQRPQGLALSATDAAGQLHVVWDRGAQPIRDSTGGSLEILDRGVRTEVHLTPKSLRSGSVSYTRLSDNVELRLVVNQPGKPAVEEMMLFLTPSQAGTPPPLRTEASAANRAQPLLPPDDQMSVKQASAARAAVSQTHTSRPRRSPSSARSRRQKSHAIKSNARSRAAKSRSTAVTRVYSPR